MPALPFTPGSDDPFHPSRRLLAVQSPIIPVVASLIRDHPGTISLGQGVVSYGPPREATAELAHFWENPGNHRYQAVEGIPELRQALADKLARENQFPINDGNALVVSAGGNLAFTNAVLAIADPGDEFILQTPFYFNHEMAVVMADCKPVLVETDGQYQLRPDAIRQAITSRTRAVVTVSPNNPTGAVYPEAALREVNALCRDAGVFHIHDEAYEYFTFDGARHFSPGSINGSAAHTISLFSMSKAYGLASWRIGYMVVPAALMPSVRKIQDTLLICAPVISQYAALGALRAGRAYCEARLADIAAVRAIFLRELGPLNALCDIPITSGAFYFLLRLTSHEDPLRIVERLVREFRVAAIPGTAFGVSNACCLRVAYGALQSGTAVEGIQRLVRGLRAILG